MSDQTPTAEPASDTPAKPRQPYRPYPATILFLVMPFLAAALALVIAGGGPQPQTGGQIQPPIVQFTIVPLVGNPAPDFALPMLGADAPPAKVSNYTGRWLILNFWATWCVPCQQEMPLLHDLATGSYGDAQTKATLKSIPGGFAILAVNRDEPRDSIEAFLKQNNLTSALPVAMDAGGALANRYRVVAMPMTYFIDPMGVIRFNQLGVLTPSLVDCYLTQMAGGKCKN